jgi:hypothetical protein
MFPLLIITSSSAQDLTSRLRNANYTRVVDAKKEWSLWGKGALVGVGLLQSVKKRIESGNGNIHDRNTYIPPLSIKDRYVHDIISH